MPFIADKQPAQRGRFVPDVPENVPTVNESIATKGLSYVKEHPYKTILEPAAKTLTGKSLLERSQSKITPRLPKEPMAFYVPRAMITDLPRDIAAMGVDIATSPISAVTAGLGALKPVQQIGKVAAGTKPVQAVGRFLTRQRNMNLDEVAGRINNSLIKSPELNKSLLYGNPGQGIAKEKIVASTLDDLHTQVTDRAKQLGDTLNSAYLKNETKLANYNNVFNPLLKLRTEMVAHPLDNKSAITRIDNILSDISGVSTGTQRSFMNLNPLEARKLKQEVDSFTDWMAVGKGDHEVNIALKKTYHNIDKILDENIPATKQLNSRISDLISAKKAIETRIRKGKTEDIIPENWWELVNVPFRVVKSPAFKTRVAAGISKSYPKNIPIEKSPPLKTIQAGKAKAIPYQTKALPAPRDVPYYPPGYRTPPVKPLTTPYSESGPTLITPTSRTTRAFMERQAQIAEEEEIRRKLMMIEMIKKARGLKPGGLEL